LKEKKQEEEEILANLAMAKIRGNIFRKRNDKLAILVQIGARHNILFKLR